VDVPTDPLLTKTPSTWTTLLDILNTPANLAATGTHAVLNNENVPEHLWNALQMKEKHNFGEILGEQGMDPGVLRSVLGLGLDIGLDPTTYIPATAFVKAGQAIKAGTKSATAAARLAHPALDNALTHVANSRTMEHLDTALNAITPGRDIRHASALTGGRYGTNAAVRDMELAAVRGQASTDAEHLFKPGLERLRQEVSTGLGAGLHGTGVGEGIDRSLQRIGGAIEANTLDTLSPAERGLADTWKQFSQGRIEKEVAEEVIRKEWKRENYFTHRLTNRSDLKSSSRAGILGDPGFVHLRKFPSLVEARLAGYVSDDNIMRLGASRALEGDRAIVFKHFFADLFRPGEDNPLSKLYMRVAKDGKPDRAALTASVNQGWRSVRLPWDKVGLVPTNLPELGPIRDYAFHPEVALDIERMFTIAPEPGVTGRIVDTLHNLWKPLATVIRPAFTFRNTASNIYANVAGGMPLRDVVKRYEEATALLWPQLQADLGKGGMEAAIAAAAHDPRAILGKAMGITGVIFGATGEVTAKPGAILKTLDQPIRTALKKADIVKVGRNISSFSENVGRMALFNHQLEKHGLTTQRLQQVVDWSQPGVRQTLSEDMAKIFHDDMAQIRDASLHVNKWMINYGIKTPFEKNYAQRWMPFYTWGRRIVPLLLETAATRPALLSVQAKLKGEVEQNLTPEERLSEARRPAWMQQDNYTQLPFTGGRNFGNLGLPGPDLNVLPTPFGSSITSAAQQMAGRISPLKLIPELLSVNRNLSMGTDSAIWRNSRTELVPASGTLSILANLSPKLAAQFGMAKKGEAWLAPAAFNYASANLVPLVESAGKAVRTTQPGKTPDEDAMARTIWNIIIGVPNVQRDTAQAETGRREGAKRIQAVDRKTLARQLATQQALAESGKK
jgi:hypothetical protein